MSDEDVKKWSGRAKPGMPMPRVPDAVRDTFIRAKGIDWTASYIDPATWIPASRTIETTTSVAYDEVSRRADGICRSLGLNLRDGGPSGPREMLSHHRQAAA